MSDCECCHGEAPFYIDHGGPGLQEWVPCPLCGLGAAIVEVDTDEGVIAAPEQAPTAEPPAFRASSVASATPQRR